MQCIKIILHHCTIAYLFPVTGDKILELIMSCPSPNDQGLEGCSVLFVVFLVFCPSFCLWKKIAHIYTLYNDMGPNNGICTLSSYCNRIFTTFVHIKLLLPLSQVSATCTRTNPNPGLGLKFLLPNLVLNVKNRRKSWTCQSQLVCFNSFFLFVLT